VRPRILTVTAPGSSGLLDGAGGRVVWWAWRETSGTAGAVLRLWDGSGPNGGLLVPISLNAGESTRDFPGWHSLPYRTGLFLELVVGSIEGQVTVVPWADDEHWGVPVLVMGNVTVDIATGMPTG
jgi:hypothetical protein